MKSGKSEKLVIQLPHDLYHQLRDQAYKHNLSLPDFVRQRVELKPSAEKDSAELKDLSELPVKDILAQTKPINWHADERLDFFHG